MFTCIVNVVGPVAGPLVNQFIFDRDPQDVNDPIISIQLTDLGNVFVNQNFVVDSAVNNWMLATALAAINTGFQVLADVDWPPPQPDDHGNQAPPYCHALLLNAA